MVNLIEFGNLRYSQFIGLWFSFVALVIGGVFYLSGFIILKNSETTSDQNPQSHSASTNTSAQGKNTEQQNEKIQLLAKYSLREYANVTLTWCAVFSWCMIPHILAGFNLFSVFYAFLITFGILNWRLSCDLKYIFPSATNTVVTSQDFADMFSKKYPARYFGAKSLMCLLSILYPILFSEICVTLNSEVSGFKYKDIMLGDVSVSTRLSRWLVLGDSCPQGAPCYVYATLVQNSSTSCYLNIHTSVKTETLKVKYRRVIDHIESGETEEKNATFAFALDVEGRGSRRVHTILLKNLLPGSEYLIDIIYSNRTQKTVKYKTLPESLPTEGIKMIYWTDLLRTDQMKAYLAELANNPVNLIHFGGNIAYDNGIFACYQCWDEFFGSLTRIFEKWGHLVPIVVQSAYYDIGSNQIAKKDLKPKFLPPFVLKFFPQGLNWKTDPNETDYYDTMAYFEFSVGDYLLLNIDSGFVSPIEGKQSEYIKSVTEKHPEKKKIAFIYEDLFDSCPNWLNYPGRANNKNTLRDFVSQQNFSLIFEGGKGSNKLTKNQLSDQKNEFLLPGFLKRQDCHPSNQSGNIKVWENHKYWTVILKSDSVDLILPQMEKSVTEDQSDILSFPLLRKPLHNQEL